MSESYEVYEIRDGGGWLRVDWGRVDGQYLPYRVGGEYGVARRGEWRVAPKLVGCWVVGVSPQQDLMKWGRDGDTEYPYGTREEALEQANYLKESIGHEEDRFYILNVFENGQMRTDEVD